MDEGSTSCYGGASLAGAVIGTFLTTVLLLAVAALVYRQWRRHKGEFCPLNYTENKFLLNLPKSAKGDIRSKLLLILCK